MKFVCLRMLNMLNLLDVGHVLLDLFRTFQLFSYNIRRPIRLGKEIKLLL